MAIDGSHPGCFHHATMVYAVPSDSGHSVEETRTSYAEAASARRITRRSFTWRTSVGGILGGVFLSVSALLFSSVSDVSALVLLFVFGGLVGLAVAVGIRQHQLERNAPVVMRLPAIAIPGDVVRAAPVDSTADELVLWSILTRRYRAAVATLESLPYEAASAADTPTTPAEHDASARTGTLSPTAPVPVAIQAELAYVTARHDFEPVAEILGLSLAGPR